MLQAGLTRVSLATFSVALAVLYACSPSVDEAPGSGSGGMGSGTGVGGITGSGGTSGAGGYVASTGGDNVGNVTGSTGGTTGPGDPNACTAVSQAAEKTVGGKADIIWVLDNSGSMATEAVGIQQNMNFFSDFITKTGIDVHVVAVSTGPGLDIFGIQTPPYGICVAPPLGSGQPCPGDTNPPLYTHVIQEVDSHNALEQLMGTYPQWQSVIRPDSTKTFVVVTDDAANRTPTTADFTTFWNGAWPGSKWRFSGIFCKGPSANCAGNGAAYTELVTQTGGVWADLGNPNPDWSGVFKQLGDAILADAKPVDCEWKIPPPPEGQTFDKQKVNVRFTPSTGAAETLVAVPTAPDCTDQNGGWYYDDSNAPKTVKACPSSCAKMQADTGAKVEVLFGCAQITKPIQ